MSPSRASALYASVPTFRNKVIYQSPLNPHAPTTTLPRPYREKIHNGLPKRTGIPDRRKAQWLQGTVVEGI